MPNPRNEYWRDYRKRKRDEYRLKNLCIYCQGLPLPGKSICGKCNENKLAGNRVYLAKRRTRDLEEGNCVRCRRKMDTEIDKGYKVCLNCRGGH